LNKSHNASINNTILWVNRLNGTGIFSVYSDNVSVSLTNITGTNGNSGFVAGGIRANYNNNLAITMSHFVTGLSVNNSRDLLFDRFNSTQNGLFIYNVTNILVRDNNLISVGTVCGGIQLFSSNNLTILNSKLKSLASGCDALRITASNNIYGFNSSFDGNSVNGINFISGSNVTINRSLIWTSSGSLDTIQTSASSSNLLVENSELRTGAASGGSVMTLAGQNATFRNLNTTSNAYLLSATSTARNILLNNITHRSTTSSTNVGGLVSSGGNNISVQNIFYNYTMRNVTMFNFINEAKNNVFTNINGFNNLTNVNLSNQNAKGLVFSRYRIANITFNNVTFTIINNVLNSTITNVTNLKILNCVFNSTTKTNLTINNTDLNMSNSYINGYKNTIYYRFPNRSLVRNNISWNTA
jgi:hypothetical protein